MGTVDIINKALRGKEYFVEEEKREEAARRIKKELLVKDRPKDTTIDLEDGGIGIINKEKLLELQEGKKKEDVENCMQERFLIRTYDKEGELKSTKLDVDAFVSYLIKKYNFKTIYGTKSETIFVYEKGIYTSRGRQVIQTTAEKILEEYSTNHYVREIEEKIKRSTEISRKKFSKVPDELIPLENGLYNIETKTLEEYNPKYYFKSKLPLKFNKEAKCENVLSFLKEIVYPEYMQVIQEWFGFNLYRKYFIKKAMILFGEKDTGKTQILNLLIRFIGEENKCGISLQAIASGKTFSLCFLENKYSNIRDDLSSKDIVNGGEFKASTGGSYITGEKKFGDSFEFLTFAKHIFAANKIPELKDNDDVFYARCLPIPFDNPIPKDTQDPFILKKITTKEEMSGLLNWALEGLDRLFKNRCFSLDKTDAEIKNLMERDAEPLAGFVQDCLVKEAGFKITKDEMFRIYTKWCEDNKKPRLSKEQLGRRLPNYAPTIMAKTTTPRCWEGYNINSKQDTLYTLLQNLRVKEKRDSNTLLTDKISKKPYKVCKDKDNIDKPKIETIKIPDEKI